jgi:hypothetical protein
VKFKTYNLNWDNPPLWCEPGWTPEKESAYLQFYGMPLTAANRTAENLLLMERGFQDVTTVLKEVLEKLAELQVKVDGYDNK